jgi:hypothetical protein
MEHNLAKYAKYYFGGNIKIWRGGEFTRKIDHGRRDFSRFSKHMLKTSYTLNLEQSLKIAHELKIYFWQNLKLEKT